MLNEDDSDGSSQPDDDGSEDGETDDHSQEDYTLGDELLERRTTSGQQRNNLAPQSMQWAIRNRDQNRSSVRVTGGSSLVFIDPTALRRTTAASAAVAAAQEPHTMATTASSLARAFGIVLRQVCQLFNTVAELYNNGLLQNLNMTYEEANELHVRLQDENKGNGNAKSFFCVLQMNMEARLKPTWDWMLTVMDATEAQLRFGASLTHSTDPSHPLHPLHPLNPTQSTSNSSNTIVSGINVLGSKFLFLTFLGIFYLLFFPFLATSQQRRTTLPESSQNTAGTTSTRFVGFSTNPDNQRNFDRDGTHLLNYRTVILINRIVVLLYVL